MSSNEGARFEKMIEKIRSEVDARVANTALKFRNERPPGKQLLPDEEQVKTYLQVRDNPQAWQQIVQERGMKNAVKYAQHGERLITKQTRKAVAALGMELPEELKPRKYNPVLTQVIVQQLQQMQQPQQPQQPQPAPAPAPQEPMPMGGETQPPGEMM